MSAFSNTAARAAHTGWTLLAGTVKLGWRLICRLFRLCLRLGPLRGTALFALIALAALAVLAVLALGARRAADWRGWFGSSDRTASAPYISDIRMMRRLYPLTVFYGDFLRQKSRAENLPAEYIVLFRGEAMLGVNLEKLTVVDCNAENRLLTVRLEPPFVENPRVDEVVEVTASGTAAMLQRMAERAPQAAQRLVAGHAAAPEYAAMAKEQTLTVLDGMYAPIGWRLKIVWTDSAPEPSGGDAAR